MAEATKKFDFDAVDRQWLRIACDNQIKMLMRARTKEVVGGEVHAMRGREIDQLNKLKEKLA